MELTYNPFVDNGIFVTATLLNKSVDDLTYDDLKSNINKISNILFERITEDEEYRKLCEKVYTHNSCLTSNLGKRSRDCVIKDRISSWIENDEDDFEKETCIMCGKKLVTRNCQPTRADLPGISSNAFMNYSNNLQIVNVCPVCAFFSLMASFNMIKSGLVLIINSDDKNLMLDWTNYVNQYIKALENEKDEVKKKKKKIGLYDHIKNTLKFVVDKADKRYKGYISIVGFDNMGQSEAMKEYFISFEKVNFLYKLKEHDLLEQFFNLNLLKLLFKNSSNDDYLDIISSLKIEDVKKEFETIEKILSILDEEVSSLSENIIKLVKNICKKIYSLPQNNEIKTLKNIQSLADFESVIIKWQEEYKKNNQENLFEDIEEFEIIVNSKTWQSIKRRMICQMLILGAE